MLSWGKGIRNVVRDLVLHNTSLRVDSSLETLMTCMGHYGIKPPTYEKFIMKNHCIRTNNMLKNGLMYLY